MTNGQIDLKTLARQTMTAAGFHPDFSPDVMREAQAVKAAPPNNGGPMVQDLRNLLWSSIDNDNSRDLDQVEYVEKFPDGSLRLMVGIADVDASVPKGSATDRQAADQTTSVYTGVATFPMLPDEFSTAATSLLNDQERVALVIELHITNNGEVDCYSVARALIRNRSKLAYSSTGAWLAGTGPLPPAAASVPGMDAQLRLQLETSDKLRGIRKEKGLLAFSSVEAQPDVENGQVKGLSVMPENSAEDIIESFMVAANVAMAKYLRDRGALSIRRVVKTPKRWDRIQAIAAQYGFKLPGTPDPRALADFLDARKAADPDHFPDLSFSVVKLLGPGEYIVETPGQEHEGHFGLAAEDYTHSTAPNRRYADLITQRLLKAASAGNTGDQCRIPSTQPSPPMPEKVSTAPVPGPYTEAELTVIAAHCTEREDAAKKVERTMRKIIAASWMSKRIGEVFEAIVTGASPKGTYVRLLKWPVEGMVVRGAQGLDVGDKTQVKLVGVNVAKGFIDFERK